MPVSVFSDITLHERDRAAAQAWPTALVRRGDVIADGGGSNRTETGRLRLMGCGSTRCMYSPTPPRSTVLAELAIETDALADELGPPAIAHRGE
jgi:hypothetical protein